MHPRSIPGLLPRAALALAMLGHAAAQVTLKPAAQVPDNASPEISGSFASFATEAASFYNYSMGFSQNIFKDYQKRTGAPIIFRVGGTSMDSSTLDMTLKDPYDFPDGQKAGLSSKLVLGPQWLESFGRLTKVVKMQFIIMAPIAKRNAENMVTFIDHCVQSMGVDNLYAVSIGNEPNYYPGWMRPKSYDVTGYAADVKNYTDLLSANVSSIPKGRVFQVFDNGSGGGGETFTASKFMDALKGKQMDVSRIKTVSQHFYQTTKDKPDAILNHMDIADKSQKQLKEGADMMKQGGAYADLEYTASEVGSTIGVEDKKMSGLAAAIWTVDWMLYSMTMGVDRVHIQQGRQFTFAPWLTWGSQPLVQGPLYGQMLVADFIGTQRGLRVAALQPNTQGITAYAGYDAQGALSRVVVVNTHEYVKSDDGNGTPRGAQDFKVNVGDKGKASGASVKASYVTGPSSDAASGLSYAGLDWAGDGNPKLVGTAPKQLKPDADGVVTLTVHASEAVLLTW